MGPATFRPQTPRGGPGTPSWRARAQSVPLSPWAWEAAGVLMKMQILNRRPGLDHSGISHGSQARRELPSCWPDWEQLGWRQVEACSLPSQGHRLGCTVLALELSWGCHVQVSLKHTASPPPPHCSGPPTTCCPISIPFLPLRSSPPSPTHLWGPLTLPAPVKLSLQKVLDGTTVGSGGNVHHDPRAPCPQVVVLTGMPPHHLDPWSQMRLRRVTLV